MQDFFSFSDLSEQRQSTALGSSKLRFEFTGTGASYFRIWAVNLILVVMTFGAFYPWAKVRRLRFFLAHTQLDGDPFEYDGEAAVLARGHALLLGLCALGLVGCWYSKFAGAGALLLSAVIYPALLHASKTYYLTHVQWRGLRFGFTGTWQEAYWASTPFLAIGAVGLSVAVFVPWTKLPVATMAVAIGCMVALVMGLLPWTIWNATQYQHQHFTLGNMKARFRAKPLDFYRVFLPVYLLTVVVISIATAMAMDWQGAISAPGGTNPFSALRTLRSMAPPYLALVSLALWLLVQPFTVSRVQNLAWTQTGNSSVRCISRLRYRSLAWLGLKNSVLTVLSMGLYWPFAAVAVARLRVESVLVKSRLDPNILVSAARPGQTKPPTSSSTHPLRVEMAL